MYVLGLIALIHPVLILLYPLQQDLQPVRIEIEAIKVLQHDNIAKLLQVIETKTEIYLVLEVSDETNHLHFR